MWSIYTRLTAIDEEKTIVTTVKTEDILTSAMKWKIVQYLEPKKKKEKSQINIGSKANNNLKSHTEKYTKST